MSKLPYQEGTRFAVPLGSSGGYAVGVVARSGKRGRILFGYFFGPIRKTVPQIEELASLSPQESILVVRFGHQALIEKKWPIIGKPPNWDRNLWPMPKFLRRESLTNRSWAVKYSEEDLAIVESETLIRGDLPNLPRDRLSGDGAVETTLSQLLSESSPSNLPYQEGTWFAVPLRSGDGYAVGIIARSGRRGGILFGYFFGPIRKTVPQMEELASLSAQEAIEISMFGDQSILKQKWPIIGKLPNWDRNLWPLSCFYRIDRITNRAWIIKYSEEDLAREESRTLNQGDDLPNLPRDGLPGDGAVEIGLTRLLDENSLSKLLCKEGTWFAVPLPSGNGYAVGLIARTSKRNSVLFGYFFGPIRKTVPEIEELASMRLQESILAVRFVDTFLVEKKWPIIGKLPDWDRDLWPMPSFLRTDPLNNHSWTVEYSEEDLSRERSITLVKGALPNLPKDSIAYNGVVEALLTQRLEPNAKIIRKEPSPISAGAKMRFSTGEYILDPVFYLMYREDGEEFDTEPFEREMGGTAILINDIEFEVNTEGRITVLCGYCPLTSAGKTKNFPKKYKRSALYVSFEGDDGSADSRILTKKGQWPVHINEKKGWVCLGNPELKGLQLIEFGPDCIASLKGEDLVAIWLQPQFIKKIPAPSSEGAIRVFNALPRS
jgi:Immunity protein 26